MDLHITAPINSLGYGVASQEIVNALSKINGLNLSLTPIGNVEPEKKNDKAISTAIYNSLRSNTNIPSIKIWHQFDLSQKTGKPKIGFPIFELDRFSAKELNSLTNDCDILFVCSEWAKTIIKKNGIKTPTYVIPLGVDTNVFYSSPSVYRDKFIILNVGKFEKRKGHDILIRAFNDCFSQEDSAELWMMCSNPFLSKEEEEQWLSLIRNSKLWNKIHLIPRVRTQREVARIMNMATIGCFPAKAEGWNLDLLEMLACGKHVIATNYSAHTEFLDERNAHLIDIEEVEPAFDGKWFFGQGNWAKFGEKQYNTLCEHLKNLFQKWKDGYLTCSNVEGIFTASKFTWQNSANRIVEVINGIV